MRDEADVRRGLREWVAARSSGKVTAEEVLDDLPILERRVITSLQVMDLILYIEEQSGRSIDVTQLRPGAFRDVDTIWKTFFAGS